MNTLNIKLLQIDEQHTGSIQLNIQGYVLQILNEYNFKTYSTFCIKRKIVINERLFVPIGTLCHAADSIHYSSSDDQELYMYLSALNKSPLALLHEKRNLSK